jgi:hypothetical protein
MAGDDLYGSSFGVLPWLPKLLEHGAHVVFALGFEFNAFDEAKQDGFAAMGAG